MTVNIPALEIPTPQVVIQFPSDWPLAAPPEEAAKLFRISRGTLDKLCKQPGFPFVKMGKAVRIDIPRAYDWISDWTGRTIPLE